MGKIRSIKKIVEALEDAQLAQEEFKLADMDGCNDQFIYQGWEEALIFVLGGENSRKENKKEKIKPKKKKVVNTNGKNKK